MTNQHQTTMKNWIRGGALLATCALCMPSTIFAHGGTYRGPGDTVPPGGGGGGNGGGGTTPGGPSGPSNPGPGGGTTPGPTGPGPTGNGPTNGPNTGSQAIGVDLTNWQFWWGFN